LASIRRPFGFVPTRTAVKIDPFPWWMFRTNSKRGGKAPKRGAFNGHSPAIGCSLLLLSLLYLPILFNLFFFQRPACSFWSRKSSRNQPNYLPIQTMFSGSFRENQNTI
jgi:hypothetical protein